MVLSTTNFNPCPHHPPYLKFCITNITFLLKTHCSCHHTCTRATQFLHHLGTGSCLPKTMFSTKIGGVQGSIQKLGPLATVEASNFKFGTKLVWGIAYQKQCFGPKFVVVWARRASKKIGIPYLFLQPLKPATSNLIRNLGLGVPY